MDTCVTPRQLPKDLYYQVVHELRGALPPPIADTPEDRARRDNAIIALIASLRPVTADDVILASQYIAAAAQSLDCLRLARLYPTDTPHNLKCTAQSVSMMRQALGARTLLMRLQADRAKREADPATSEEAARTEYAAVSLITETLAAIPPNPIAEPPPPPPRPQEPEPATRTILTEAEKYAIANPSSAALIRSLGRLPKKFNGAPLSPRLVHDIVSGASPILQALAKRPRHRLAPRPE
jgi:hypothetical protein